MDFRRGCHRNLSGGEAVSAVLTKDAIKALQGLLTAAGFDPGPVDGLWGNRTASAVAAWGRENGQSAPAPLAAKTASVLYQGTARYPVEEIVVHCAATVPDWMAGRPLLEQVAEIRRWHVQGNGWRDIGYHWIIGRDGLILPGRPETQIGAHVVERNQGSIGICLIGGHEAAASDSFERHFTPAQAVTLRQQIAAISGRTRIRRVSGHNEYAAKGCPGFFVPDWLGWP